MADIGLTESSEVTIASSDGVNKLTVNSDGSINTVVYSGGYNSFAVSGERSAIGTIELPVLLFTNPSGSVKTVRPKTIIVANRHTVSSLTVFRVYVSPTVTSTGTALTEASTNIGNGVSVAAVTYTSPTISANGTLITTVTCPGGTTALAYTINLLPSFSMAANTAILITAVSDGSNRIAAVSVFWEE